MAYNPKVPATCSECGAVFEMWKTNAKPTRRRYCSPSCSATAQWRAHRETLRERMMARIAKQDNGCWMWLGARRRGGKGYGLVSIGRRTRTGRRCPVGAHRVFYELFKGPIAEGLQIDHLCFNPGCVNPEHLEAVTATENVDRWLRKREADARANAASAGI